MRKALIPGMFSSVSDAELITELLDAADFKDNMEKIDKDLNQELRKDPLDY